jgi:DNA-binding transcriptional MerR regulator
MGVKTQFSIKDLENLSGIKAHTIRIWEKRYQLLEPDRTQTNIRRYNLENLKKLLNVAFLYEHGHKISKIAKLSNQQIRQLIDEKTPDKQTGLALKNFKTAMFDFDEDLFQKTYSDLEKSNSFSNIFLEVFLPLLDEIGLLWQTGTLDPSHERFISELIKRKVMVAIDTLQTPAPVNAPVFALFLPLGEIHEIGLLFTKFQLLSRGFKTVYLGTNIGIDSLIHITRHYDQIHFLSYFTIKPDPDELRNYINQFNKKIGTVRDSELWLMGGRIRKLHTNNIPPNVKIIPDLNELNYTLQTLKKS